MKRRDFLTKTVAATALISSSGLVGSCIKSPITKKITILHTNDTHSRIEPFPYNHNRYALKGGVARRAKLIEILRQENPHTLLLDAGDIFQGTPYFNFYGGELEFKLMSMLKYDAATIGNHEFDNGINGLYKQLPHANFDFLIANYDFSNTIMDGQTKPYRIFNKNGIKIGVFGLGVDLEGLVNTHLYKETKYLDPIEITQDISQILRQQEHCDLVICLSHLGYDYKGDKISDLKLAKATKGVDLIIGGHTHTFLTKPTVIKNIEEKNILINQVGWGGINLGKIDFYFTDHKKADSQATTILV